jgi:hypothetical protein
MDAQRQEQWVHRGIKRQLGIQVPQLSSLFLPYTKGNPIFIIYHSPCKE